MEKKLSEEEITNRIQDLIHTCDIGIEEHGEYDDLFKLDKEALQGLLDLYNKEKLNSLNLSEQLNKEKEKNKELQDCLQMAKQIMTADISEDFDCMKLKEFKKYLLNEIKLNENFEE